jgi:Tol biopolymer transport system component
LIHIIFAAFSGLPFVGAYPLGYEIISGARIVAQNGFAERTVAPFLVASRRINDRYVGLRSGSDQICVGVCNGAVERHIAFVPIVNKVAERVRVKIDKLCSGCGFRADVAPGFAKRLPVTVGSPHHANRDFRVKRNTWRQGVGNILSSDLLARIAFRPDGDSLIAAASDGGKFFHLWKVFYSDGEVQRLTNGLNSYGKVSISVDGKKILALQIAESSNLFVASQENLNEPKQITFGNGNSLGQTALDWMDENKLVYVSYTEENPMANLWSININDRSRQQLTANFNFHSDSPTVAADGKAIYFTTSQSPFVNAWRMDATGGNLTQITDGKDGWRMFPQVSQDGKYLYYIFRNREGGGIKRFNLAQNQEETLFDKGTANPVSGLSLSQDGKHLTFINWVNNVGGDDDKSNFQLGIISTENPNEMKFFDVRLLRPVIALPSAVKAFDYVSWDKGKSTILRQSIEGGEPKEIFTLPKARIFYFAWSKSGKQLAISHGHQYRDAVLLSNFE